MAEGPRCTFCRSGDLEIVRYIPARREPVQVSGGWGGSPQTRYRTIAHQVEFECRACGRNGRVSPPDGWRP